MKCAVLNCHTHYKVKASECSLFSFPANPVLRKKWMQFCRQSKDYNFSTSYICMEHFVREDFENIVQFEMGFAKKRILKREAVPSIYKPSDSNPERSQRVQRRRNKEIVDELLRQSEESTSHEADLTPNEELELHGDDDLETTRDKENCGFEANRCSDVSLMHCRPATDSDLQTQIEMLQAENLALQKENRKLKSEITALKREYFWKEKKLAYNVDLQQKRALKAEFACKNMEDKLAEIFTRGQIEKLKNGSHKKVANWSEKDIAQSITFYAAGAKSYKLMYKKGFPLPGVRTLQKWAQKIDVSKGILQPVLKIMAACTHMSERQKLAVLCFDEMKIRKTYCYDTSSDSTLAPVSYVQVVMLRGLVSNWKQPVFYNYDCRMTPDILNNILQSTTKCGYNVVATVCDYGGTNKSLLNDLGVNENQPWFMFEGEKIFVLADVPHMIKLLRNHFIDQGFYIDGKRVDKSIILELLTCTSKDLTITHKISASHLQVTGPQRQRVKMATKLFSHTVAQAITRAASLGHLSGKNWEECFQLFKKTNDWFDVMNVRVPYSDARERRHGYGLAADVQNKVLDEMTELVTNMRVIGRNVPLPFQKGIIQSNKAVKMLLETLQRRFNVKYILTYHLNQDVLENFFGVIRAKGGLHDHPDQQEFKYRLRSYILGRNEGAISTGGNVEIDDTPDLEVSQPTLTGAIFRPIGVTLADVEQKEFDDLEYDGLENLAGYICHRFRDDIPSTSRESRDNLSLSWANHLSEGGLAIPSDSMMENMTQLESVFVKLNGDSLLITSDFIKKHIELASEVPCDIKIKKLFFRSRMYTKIRKLNNGIVENARKRKRKYTKILT